MGPDSSPEPAEAALREALKLDPRSERAESLLTALLAEQGRFAEVAQHFEDASLQASDPSERARLLLRAAQMYQERANKPHEAAAALLAARAAAPDDLALTERAADMLHQLGRRDDAAELDALLLEKDPFHRAFQRQLEHLEGQGEHQRVAALMLKRAERQTGDEAARSYLAAAAAFRRSGALEQALLCEDQAFDRAPSNDAAFEARRERVAHDVRALSELLYERAKALPEGRVELLRDRAERLIDAGEVLLAAEALDDLLEESPDDVRALAARADLAAQSGGPEASHPYDRRLLAASTDALPRQSRVRSQLRVGHASLNRGAMQDAGDAFQAVIALDPEGEAGKEALSLLSEVYAKTHNAKGVYETSLLLAGRVRTDEAEALLRRAAEQFDDPTEAIDALLPLSKLRPADMHVLERAARGLKALGRHVDLIELYRRGADAIGGGQAAALLLEAARVAEAALDDKSQAAALKEKAGRLDPHNPDALRALAEVQRHVGDAPQLLDTLTRLAGLVVDPDEAALLGLERAQLLEAAGRVDEAIALLDAHVAQGPSAAGYASALELLERWVKEPIALSRVLAARAEVAQVDEKEALLLRAAETALAGDAVEPAAAYLRAALALRPAPATLRRYAELLERQADWAKAAVAWKQAVALSETADQAELLLRAADASEKANENAEAAELLERAASEFPQALSGAALAERLERLGAHARAAAHGFAPALAEGRYADAVALAERAGDAAQVEEALWGWVEAGSEGASAALERLRAQLSSQGNPDGLVRLAQAGERFDRDVASALWLSLATSAYEGQWSAALQGLTRLGALEPLTQALAASPELGAQADWLARRENVPASLKDAALAHLAAHHPLRARQWWREAFDAARAVDDLEALDAAVVALTALEEAPLAKSALQLELAERALAQGDLARAKAAFERALAYDPNAVAAVRQLAALLTPDGEPDKLVAMAERLDALAGAGASDFLAEKLVDAYRRLGRGPEALAVLGKLPETTERLFARAALAESLGFLGEALQLRERLTDEPKALEQVLLGYVEQSLVPFAVRLADRLLAGPGLSAATQRLLAERLAPTPQGAALGARLWLELLRQNPTDADGWTYLSEALARLGHPDKSLWVDGFGGALTSSLSDVAPLAAGRIEWAPVEGVAVPPDAVEVNEASMPRLFRLACDVLPTLAGRQMTLWLDPRGGVEAYVAGDALVTGALALARFGPGELTYLWALALVLGPRGNALRQPGAAVPLADAAAAAFTACPLSLSACRVLALLDERVRGQDPFEVDIGAVVAGSAAFRALVEVALAEVATTLGG